MRIMNNNNNNNIYIYIKYKTQYSIKTLHESLEHINAERCKKIHTRMLLCED